MNRAAAWLRDSVPASGTPPLSGVDLGRAVSALLDALSCERPVLLVVEDLHWADDSSLDVINRLGEIAPQLRLLIVGAARQYTEHPARAEIRPEVGANHRVGLGVE